MRVHVNYLNLIGWFWLNSKFNLFFRTCEPTPENETLSLSFDSVTATLRLLVMHIISLTHWPVIYYLLISDAD